jgi:glycosyltransferase involved in cell wall biosynthesis
MATEPAISVVVATHNRARLLPRLVARLEAQEPCAPFEVIVVDDGSTDGTSAMLEDLTRATPLDLVTVRMTHNSGPAAARNAGWRRARAPLVAFTDDDCAPQPGWLTRLVDDLNRFDLVQGRTIPDPEQLLHRNAFSHTIYVEGEWGFYEACNMGYRRDVLEARGGFDEGFTYGRFAQRETGPIFGEDTDLAWRAKRAGARVTFDGDAVVFHDVRRQSYVDHLRGMRRREGVALTLKRIPELRELCHYGVFWRPSHPLALLAAVGLATAARRRPSTIRLLVGAALTVPYVRYRTKVVPTGRPRNRPVVIPLTLLSDLAETAVLLAGSVRYRTFVL